MNVAELQFQHGCGVILLSGHSSGPYSNGEFAQALLNSCLLFNFHASAVCYCNEFCNISIRWEVAWEPDWSGRRSAQFQLCKHYRLLLSGVIQNLLAITRCSICSPTTCNGRSDHAVDRSVLPKSHRVWGSIAGGRWSSWGWVPGTSRGGASGSPPPNRLEPSINLLNASNYPLYSLWLHLPLPDRVHLTQKYCNRRQVLLCPIVVHRGWWQRRWFKLLVPNEFGFPFTISH